MFYDLTIVELYQVASIEPVIVVIFGLTNFIQDKILEC